MQCSSFKMARRHDRMYIIGLLACSDHFTSTLTGTQSHMHTSRSPTFNVDWESATWVCAAVYCMNMCPWIWAHECVSVCVCVCVCVCRYLMVFVCYGVCVCVSVFEGVWVCTIMLVCECVCIRACVCKIMF